VTFRKTVAAYLTGWLIAQPLYAYLQRRWRRNELKNPSEDTIAYWHEQACAIVDVMENRGHLSRFPHTEEDGMETEKKWGFGS
jgi:hypothetical protein